MCDHNWLNTDYTKVCNKCGIEQRILPLDKYCKFSAPLCRGYDRGNRFKSKVYKLLGMHGGPNANDPIWKILEQHRDQLNTPGDIRRLLRRTKLKNKHYDSIRIFTDAFTEFRIKTPHDVTMFREILLLRFRKIHSDWCRYTAPENTNFFSYDFLLRHILEDIHSPLTIYCKPPTSKRRKKKYLIKLALIQAHSSDRRCCCGPVRHHSQNVLMNSYYPQC